MKNIISNKSIDYRITVVKLKYKEGKCGGVKVMRKVLGLGLIIVFTLLLASPALEAPGKGKDSGFVHGIVIKVDGEDYYLLGPPDGPGGARDIPGRSV